MDRRERAGEAITALMAALQGNQSAMWTALPGVVAELDGGPSFDPQKRTVAVQPTLQALLQAPDGEKAWVTMPMLVDCPVYFPGGGGATLTFPIRTGDECLVVFSSRCIDAWWQSGGVQNQPELRMHDLSDGFAFVGVSSLPHVVDAISTSAAQLRDDAGTTLVELDPGGTFVNIRTPGDVGVEAGGDVSVDAGGQVMITASGGATINAETIINGETTIVGNLTVTGVILAPTVVAAVGMATPAISISGKDYAIHTHTGVSAGPSNTGPVTP